jgi:hypothetical protein
MLYLIGYAIVFGLAIAVIIGLMSLPFYAKDIFSHFMARKAFETDFAKWDQNHAAAPKDSFLKEQATLADIIIDCEKRFKELNIRDPKLKSQIIEQALKEHGFNRTQNV